MHPASIDPFYWAAGLFVHLALLIVLWMRHRVIASEPFRFSAL
jgi:hypothetical protein